MKKIIITLVLIGSGILLSTCNKVDELPPVSESTSNKNYRMPDPVPLSIQEAELVEEIRREYRNSLPN